MAHRRAGRGADVRRLRGARSKDDYARVHARVRGGGERAWPRTRSSRSRAHIGAARGSASPSHVWRGSASGNLGGWQVARALQLLTVLTAQRRHRGRHVARAPGTSSSRVFFESRPPQKDWNELLFPREWPLSHYEMSFLLPHFLKEGRGKLDTYFTRVYNPVWTNPDGFTWIEVLSDEAKIGLHAALTPTWNETAFFADYVLPMGHAGERHDIQSQETHAGKWIGFRQPVAARGARAAGREGRVHLRGQPGRGLGGGRVLDRAELAHRPRRRARHPHAGSSRPYRPGEKITVDEYYRWIFENAVPGLPEAAAARGARARSTTCAATAPSSIESDVHEQQRKPQSTVPADARARSARRGAWTSAARRWASRSTARSWPASRRRRAASSSTRARSRTGAGRKRRCPATSAATSTATRLDAAQGEMRPAADLPAADADPHAQRQREVARTRSRTATRSGSTPRTRRGWASPPATSCGSTTEIGYFVNHAWVTEAIAPGVVACSHHLGRWRLHEGEGSRWSTAAVRLGARTRAAGSCAGRRASDRSRAPIPIRAASSGATAACTRTSPSPCIPTRSPGCTAGTRRSWSRARRRGDRYGDVFVDTNRSMAVYREWLALARPGPGPGGLRRPLWLDRPLRPTEAAFRRAAGAADGARPTWTDIAPPRPRDRPRRASCCSSPTSWPAASPPSPRACSALRERVREEGLLAPHLPAAFGGAPACPWPRSAA